MRIRVAVFVPAYKRPEYTEKCINSIKTAQEYGDGVKFFLTDDGSNDGTCEILKRANLPGVVTVHSNHCGLRSSIIEFFKMVRDEDFKYLAKIDNDVLVPNNFLSDIVAVFEDSDADILSPNVRPSDAAIKLGTRVNGKPYLASSYVGGVWVMKKSMIDGVDFENYKVFGISGAFHIINQIIVEKEPVVGWLESVSYEDMGHWSGLHPEHIKSEDHYKYSAEVGRSVAWTI